VRVSEAFIVGHVPTFLSEIKVHGSRFVSQYVRRSSRVMVPKVSWARGLTYVLLLVSVMPDACDGAEGGFRCKASDLYPQQ
jgi:hypothetical protein